MPWGDNRYSPHEESFQRVRYISYSHNLTVEDHIDLLGDIPVRALDIYLPWNGIHGLHLCSMALVQSRAGNPMVMPESVSGQNSARCPDGLVAAEGLHHQLPIGQASSTVGLVHRIHFDHGGRHLVDMEELDLAGNCILHSFVSAADGTQSVQVRGMDHKPVPVDFLRATVVGYTRSCQTVRGVKSVVAPGILPDNRTGEREPQGLIESVVILADVAVDTVNRVRRERSHSLVAMIEVDGCCLGAVALANHRTSLRHTPGN
jgi:hypothetical protein